MNDDEAKERLLAKLEAAWGDFVASYGGLPPNELQSPGVAGSWSVRDIIAHVTSWEEEALAHLPGVLRGVRPPRYSVTYGGIDAFNARTMEARRALSFDDVLRQQREVHDRLVAFVRAAPAEACRGDTKFRKRLRLDTYGHYPKHAAAIRRWRERTSR
jgi:hypothetical protein